MVDLEAITVATNKKDCNYVQESITVFIMSKLPLKSLKRFECVSKSWLELFESRYFRTIYRNNLMSNNHYDDTYLVLHHGELTNKFNYHCEFYFLSGERFENRVKLDWPPPFKDDDTGIYILGSVSIDGIFCLKQRVGNRLVLWNPTTKEFKVIPPSPFEYVPPHETSMYNLHGFGYDHVTNEYKVINFVNSVRLVDKDEDTKDEDTEDEDYEDEASEDEDYEDEIIEDEYEDNEDEDKHWEMYSLRSNTWRKLDVNMPNHSYYTLKHDIGVYMNGMCHWWAITNASVVMECLVSFDFSREVLFTTPKPSYRDFGYVEDRQLAILNGSIGLVSSFLYSYAIAISILGEVGVQESWTRLFVVRRLPSVKFPIGAGKKSNILFFKTEDDKLVWVDVTCMVTEGLIFKIERFGYHAEKYKKKFLLNGELIFKLGEFGSHVGKYKKSFLPMGIMNN